MTVTPGTREVNLWEGGCWKKVLTVHINTRTSFPSRNKRRMQWFLPAKRGVLAHRGQVSLKGFETGKMGGIVGFTQRGGKAAWKRGL